MSPYDSPHFDPILLIVLKSDQFWYVISYMDFKNLKEVRKTAHLVQKWASAIFSTFDPYSLKVHENDQFRYNFNNHNPYMKYQILKWADETAHLTQQWTRTIFFHILHCFSEITWKRTILICYNLYQSSTVNWVMGLWNELPKHQDWVENEPRQFFLTFHAILFIHSADKLSILMCKNLYW